MSNKKKTIAEKLLSYAEKNPSGFTVKVVNGRIIPIKASKKNRYVISKTNYDSVDKIKKGFKGFKSGIVGGWFDSKTGKYYIDKNIIASKQSRAKTMGKKYKQKAIFDMVKMKEITLTQSNIKNIVIKRKGKWYNPLTKRYVSESTARRYNSYFKRNPEGNITRAWGGYKYQKDVKVAKQGIRIKKLWRKNIQTVTTKNIKGEKVEYSPFEDKIVEKEMHKILKKLDYRICNNKIHVHLYRISRDGKKIFHIVRWDIDRSIKSELAYRDFINFVVTSIIPCLRHEFFKIKNKHKIGSMATILAHSDVNLYSDIDYFNASKVFGMLIFNNDGINRIVKEILDILEMYYRKLEINTYHNIYFNNIAFYIDSFTSQAYPKAVQIAKYRIGVLGIENGDKY